MAKAKIPPRGRKRLGDGLRTGRGVPAFLQPPEEEGEERERERFKGWAKRWGTDEPDACRLHHHVFKMLERHIMRITAAQFVWSPAAEDADVPDAEAAASEGDVAQRSSAEGEGDPAPKRRRPEMNEPTDHETH